MIKLKWKDKWIEYETLEWSGTHNQCSRMISFTLPWNPYDKEFEKVNINLGDLVYLFDDNNQLFVGTITTREKTAEIGTASYVAMDFMHHLLKSNASYKFTKTTPEKITEKVCSDLQIPTTKLAKTKASILSIIFDAQCVYDIIVSAYRKAKAITGKIYMPVMVGNQVSVIEKGADSGVTLTNGVDIINATYNDTTDNMINMVLIYDEKLKKKGQVQNDKDVASYGVYQQTYTKETGVNAKSKAKSMMVGITKEASVEAIGNIKAISGYAIQINDPATGLTGKFYITSDSHMFENGSHTMTLGISWKNEEEQGAQTEEEKGKKELKNSAKCYYLDSSTVYHSSKKCSACKGKKGIKTSTVAKIKKIKITKGKNKGKRKFKPCSKCWIQ